MKDVQPCGYRQELTGYVTGIAQDNPERLSGMCNLDIDVSMNGFENTIIGSIHESEVKKLFNAFQQEKPVTVLVENGIISITYHEKIIEI